MMVRTRVARLRMRPEVGPQLGDRGDARVGAGCTFRLGQL
jgi:hypothetical protein